LSTKGNKATIVARLQQYDTPTTPLYSPPSTRFASTEAVTPDVQVSAPEIVSVPSGEKGIASGIAPKAKVTYSAKAFLSTALPDLAKPDPVPSIQIPYVPDFWESSNTSRKAPVEQPLPKVLVVADANAHHNSAVTQNLLEETVSSDTVPPSTEPGPGSSQSDGIVSDIVEDLGLGSWAETKKNWRKLLS
jgi:hypothetical protein